MSLGELPTLSIDQAPEAPRAGDAEGMNGVQAALKNLPPTLSVEQASQLVGISKRSAYRAAATGELPTFKVGRRLLVPTARLLDLLGLGTDETVGPTATVNRRGGGADGR
jgi:excisionase family DNA binding protein